jgi:hypothetical protein
MKISLTDDSMTVSNRIKFLISKYGSVNIVLSGSTKGTHLVAIYNDWHGVQQEKIIGTF